MPTHRRVMLFLGAGLSTVLGYPDTVGAVVAFEKELRARPRKNRNLVHKLNSLKSGLSDKGIDFDSESFYSCLQGFVRSESHLRDAGPFAQMMARQRSVPTWKSLDSYRILKGKFERFLLNTYYRRDRELEAKVVTLFNRLLCRAAGVRNWEDAKPPNEHVTFEIFTTNYDLSVEIYADLEGLTINKGYRLDTNANVIFTPEDYRRGTATINLYKLHGSVQWSLLKNGLIKEDMTLFPGEGEGESRVIQKVMVYGLNKDLTAEPFFDLLYLMKSNLKSVRRCTVLGYSFRDPWIRNVFRDVIRSEGDRMSLTYIDKSPKRKIQMYPFLRNVTSLQPGRAQRYLNL